jgi:PAS domain S-box-containing protein
MAGLRLDLAEALAGAADGALVIGPDGRILSWNRAAAQILGYRANETVGRQCCEILAGQDVGGARICAPGCPVMTLARDGKTAESFDVRAHTKAGRPVWLNLSTLTARSAGRTFVAHLFRDVTATREQRTQITPATMPEEPRASLTLRERQVVRLLTGGASTREMAARLRVSRTTIRNHVQHLLDKLGVHSRLEAVVLMSGHGQRRSIPRASEP